MNSLLLGFKGKHAVPVLPGRIFTEMLDAFQVEIVEETVRLIFQQHLQGLFGRAPTLIPVQEQEVLERSRPVDRFARQFLFQAQWLHDGDGFVFTLHSHLVQFAVGIAGGAVRGVLADHEIHLTASPSTV